MSTCTRQRSQRLSRDAYGNRDRRRLASDPPRAHARTGGRGTGRRGGSSGATWGVAVRGAADSCQSSRTACGHLCRTTNGQIPLSMTRRTAASRLSTPKNRARNARTIRGRHRTRRKSCIKGWPPSPRLRTVIAVATCWTGASLSRVPPIASRPSVSREQSTPAFVIGVKDWYRVVWGPVSQDDYESAVAVSSRMLAIRLPAVGKHPVLLQLGEVLAVSREDVVGRAKDVARDHLQARLLSDSNDSTLARRDQDQICLRVSRQQLGESSYPRLRIATPSPAGLLACACEVIEEHDVVIGFDDLPPGNWANLNESPPW
jgi:hypothetical protein